MSSIPDPFPYHVPFFCKTLVEVDESHNWFKRLKEKGLSSHMIRFIDHGYQKYLKPTSPIDQYIIRYCVYNQVVDALNKWISILDSTTLPKCLQSIVMACIGILQDSQDEYWFYIDFLDGCYDIYDGIILDSIIFHHFGINKNLRLRSNLSWNRGHFLTCDDDECRTDISLWSRKDLEAMNHNISD